MWYLGLFLVKSRSVLASATCRHLDCKFNLCPSQTCVSNPWRLPRGHCQGSPSVCTPQCWTAVSSLRLSDCPCCASGPGWPGAWMTSAPPIPLGRCRGPARCRSAAGSPGWGSRARTFASWPSERPWCSAGCRSSVNRGKAMLRFQSREHRKHAACPNCSHDMANLFGFALLNPPLCVTNVQIFGVLRVQVGHNVGPPLEKKPHVHGPKTTGENSWGGRGRGLLFTVDGWVFPAGLANKNPVFHFICREGSPEHTTKQTRDNKLAYCG